MSERTKAIDQAILQIEKQFGKGSIMKLGQGTEAKVDSIPSGSIALDLALGIGGYPRGRVVEIYGPEASGKTTLALHAIAAVQRTGGTAAFIDAEHALDAGWARICGVNTDELLISQPDTGEQGLEITETLVRSGAVDLVVVDSVAALVPKAEIEGEMGDAHVGMQARLMSQALRKLTGTISKTKTTVIFINQLREKIGVMFGCVPYTSNVMLADGQRKMIGKIVNQQLPVDVLTLDMRAGSIVGRPVTGWFNNGRTDDFLVMTVHRPAGLGRARVTATPDHQVLTPEGFAPVRALRPGDQVMMSQWHRLSPMQQQVLRGGLLGDTGLRGPRQEYLRGVSIRLGHGSKQADYLRWKVALFGNIPGAYYQHSSGKSYWDSTPLVELFDLYREVYTPHGKTFSAKFLGELSPLALAIWYMDDGGCVLRGKREITARIQVCVEAMTPDSRTRLQRALSDRFGITAALRTVADNAILYFERDATRRFHQLIAPYIHPTMSRKLLPDLRVRFDVEPQFIAAERRVVPAFIADIHQRPNSRGTHRGRYDIEVEGTHNFLVDDVVVHNSPETTTGGKALKFYASIRLDVRPIEPIKNGTEVIGRRVKVKVVKNKVAPPFRLAELEILATEGISREGGLVDMGLITGVVTKYGAWFNYGEQRLGQGRENAKQFLREHADVAAELEAKVREKSGSTALPAAGAED